ncbi:MAG TPA: hypothetical protein PLD84_02420 [Chitinophagales bacterium]|nr:hypothetical protein [Chitinophagales bacterium]
MKLFCYLFSIYILALSVVPCNDPHECENNGQLVFLSAPDHSDHSHETESCSPFCICSCCGTQSISQFVQDCFGNNFPVTASKAHSIYSSVFIVDFFAAIWQPPKIA